MKKSRQRVLSLGVVVLILVFLSGSFVGAQQDEEAQSIIIEDELAELENEFENVQNELGEFPDSQRTEIIDDSRVSSGDINKSAGDLRIEQGMIVNGNVTLSMGALTVFGVVNGDVTTSLGEVIIIGDVNGDVDANMGKIQIDGNVSGNVRGQMGEIIINGNVGGNVEGELGSIRINGRVAGDVKSGLGELKIFGFVGGNVSSEGKVVNIDGIVNGDIRLTRGIVELGHDAMVKGTVLVDRGMVKKSAGAEVGDIIIDDELSEAEIERLFGFDGITFRGVDNFRDKFSDGEFWRNINLRGIRDLNIGPIPFFGLGWAGWYGNLARKIMNMAIFFALGALIFTLFPKQVGNVKKALEINIGSVVLWGVLATVVALPLAILLAITIVGILLIPLEVLVLATAWIIGYVAIALLLGGRVITVATPGRSANPLGEIGLGVVLLGLISFIPVIGFLVGLAVFILAVGAVLFTRFGTISPPPPPASSVVPDYQARAVPQVSQQPLTGPDQPSEQVPEEDQASSEVNDSVVDEEKNIEGAEIKEAELPGSEGEEDNKEEDK